MDGGTGTAMGRASGEKRVELEFKQMADYRQELRNYYMATARYMDIQKIDEGVSRLTDPLDNAIKAHPDFSVELCCHDTRQQSL